MLQQTVKQWEYVFLIAAAMLIVSGILYMLFADSTLQSWNSMEDTDALDGKELVNLKVDVEHSVQNSEKKVSGDTNS